ncbi:MAG: SHOCT domain-containing protein [Alphaproteobacteria bacterium]
MRHVSLFPCLVFLTLAACSGGGADTTMTATTVSKGQEIIDLQKARDSGAISADEFERQKSKVLSRD